MKRRFLSTLMALCLALSLLPTAAFAAERDEAPVEEMPVEVQPMEEPLVEETAGPTASGNYFFANGTPITITATAPGGGEEVLFEGFSATGESAYISWDDNGTTKYVGVNDTSAYVFGGSDGRKEAVTVPSTSINMTGGTIYRLFGGNYGEEGADTKFRSEVTGDVNISLSGTAVVKDLLHGAGARNTCVSGTVKMTFNSVDLSDPNTKLYVNGGSWGNGNEGIRDIEGGSMDTGAVANKVIIEANNSDFYLLSAGGSGSTKVNDAEVTLTDCKVNVLYLGGINGEVEDSSITATGCVIESFSATNRGFVGEGHVDLNDCTVDKLNTGAANGCFTSDSGGTDGSGVTGSCVWDLDESTEVTDAQLTPLVIKNPGSYTNTYENLTVQKAGDPLELEITSFVADENNENTTQNIFTVPEGSTLTLNGVIASVTKGSTFTNAGTIDMDISSSLTANEGSTFAQIGTVTGAGKENIFGDGVKTDYVARVGSTGYGTLQEAINNASSGATVTLLADVTESVTIDAGETIVLDLNGHTLTNTKESHTITNNGTLTVQDTSAGGTGTVDNVTHARGALVNYGTAELEGGTFTRSAEAGSSPSNNGGNSWYVIDNHGTMTIDGATVTSTGMYSSLIRNIKAAENEAGSLTVSSGNLSNGFIALKNDTDGIMNITGGTITSGDQAVQNWNKATISGGELTGKVYCWSAGKAPKNDTGNLTISGNAKINGEVAAIQYQYTDKGGQTITPDKAATVTITGGTVLGKVTTDARGFDEGDTHSKEAKVTVSGGHFGESVNEEYLDESLNAELKSARNTEAPYSYYASVEDALEAAQPGDSVKAVNVEDEASTYTLTLDYNDNNATADSKYTVTSGTKVTLPTPTRNGYDFRYWSNGSATYNGGVSYTVTDNVTLTAQWSAKSQGGSSSGSGSTTYSPTLDVSDGGSIKVSPRTPEAGDEVTITPDPDSGYEVDQVTVTDRDGDEIRVTANRDGTYTFTQPRGRVTIEVTFVRAGESVFFDDVPASFWAYDEIAWAYDNGYVNGTSAATFSPNSSITRQQVWMILARLSGADPASMAAAREWAMVNDISDGTNPGNAVTRQQLVALLYRYAQMMGYDNGAREALTSFPDAGTVSGYAQEPMQWSVANGIVAGTSAGTLNPAGTATRAQFAVILYRFWDQVG